MLDAPKTGRFHWRCMFCGGLAYRCAVFHSERSTDCSAVRAAVPGMRYGNLHLHSGLPGLSVSGYGGGLAWRIMLCLVLLWALSGGALRGGTVLATTFDELTSWRAVTIGPAAVRLRQDDTRGGVLNVVAAGGAAFCSRELLLSAVRDSQLTIRCMTAVDSVVPGLQVWSVPKIHLAVALPDGVTHVAARLDKAGGWREASLVADVPASATRVLLNVGVENALADVAFDNLLVLNDRRDVHSIDLAAHMNVGIEWAGPDTVSHEDVAFRLPRAIAARDCLGLRGVGHESLPKQLASPIPVGVVANSVYFLHGTLGGEGSRETPCVIWTARFWDGQETSFSVFEGRDIGSAYSGRDASNWRVVWRGRTRDGKSLSFGVTRWRLFTADVPLASLTARAYAGAPPVVLAISVVADAPPEDDGSDDEDLWDEGEW